MDKVGLVVDNFFPGKNDYKAGGTFYGLSVVPKMKHCLTINELGIIEEHKTFKGFKDSKSLLDRSQNLKKM